jgi:hypothetical protein
VYFNFFSKISEIFASQGDQLESMTPAANLPLVSTTSVANLAMGTDGVLDTGGKFATCVNNTRRCQWHLWQIMGTILD